MWEFLFGPKDRSRDWVRREGLPLKFSLDDASLNSAGLGDQIDRIEFLGPAEDRRQARYGAFCYYSLGLFIECDDEGRITEIDVVYWDEDGEFQAYQGAVVYQGRPVDLQGMSKDAFLARFGPCYWEDRDDCETILFYEFRDLEWMVEFDEQQVLKRVAIGIHAVMADAKQREMYGVTRPWPPAPSSPGD